MASPASLIQLVERSEKEVKKKTDLTIWRAINWPKGLDLVGAVDGQWAWDFRPTLFYPL